MTRLGLTAALVVSLLASAAAHHGGGTFDGSKEIKLTGYLNTIVFADGKRVDRYGQLTKGAPVAAAAAKRRARSVEHRQSLQAR